MISTAASPAFLPPCPQHTALAHPPEGAYWTIVGRRVRFMLSELKPQIAVMIEAHASGVWVHSWPKRSAAAWREGRNS